MDINNVLKAFTITEVANIVDVTPRRLTYWDSTGLLKPSLKSASGRGSRRLYSFQDMVELKIIIRLLSSSLSLQRIRNSLNFMRGLPEPLTDLVIVTDGETIYVYKGKGFVVDTLRHGQTVLQIVVDDLIAEVEEKMGEFISVKAG